MTEGFESLRNLPCGYWVVRQDEELTLEYANEQLYQLFGYTGQQARELGLSSARSVVEPEDWPMVRQRLSEQLRGGASRFELEHRYTHSSGEVRWLLVRGGVVEGDPERLSGIVLDITGRKETEQLLRVSQEVGRMALSRAGSLVATYEVGLRTLVQTQEAADWFGAPTVMDDMPQSALLWGLVEPESREEFVHFFEQMNAGLPEGETLVRAKDARGRPRWLAGQFSRIPQENGAPALAVIFFQDVTERQEAELEYEQWSRRLDHPAQDELGCYEFNLTRDRCERGVPTLEARGHSYSDTVGRLAEDVIWHEDVEAYLQTFDRRYLLLRYCEGRRDVSLEHRRRGPEGEALWTRASIHLLAEPRSGDIMGVVWASDIHEEKEQALHLQRTSERDPLTGCYNRRAMVEHIAEVLHDSPPGACHGLLMMDIDQFTQLNDSFGRHFGDQVIRDMAQTLEGQLRSGDFCGRMGGDEFLVFLRNVRGGSSLEPRLASMLRGLTRTYEACTASMSIGLVNYPRSGRDFDTLYRRAELALAEARRGGSCRYAVYESGLGT